MPEGSNGAEQIGPEDTFDAQYSRILDGAQKRLLDGQCLATLTGFEPAIFTLKA